MGKFHTIQKKGYFIRYDKKNEAEDKFSTHYFCGKHKKEDAFCPNCKKPLLRFLLLDTNDDRLPLKNKVFRYLPIYFCWTCNIAQDPFYYRVSKNSIIEILKYDKGGVEKDFPYNNYPIYFPERFAILKKMSDKEQVIITQLNDEESQYLEINDQYIWLEEPQHQICGEPYLVQSRLDKLSCPICKREMPFLVSVADDCVDKRGFVNNSYVQVVFYYCKECFVVCSMQQCD